MIDDLDEALRQLLVREMPIKNGEVEIEFKQPTKEWSSRLSRPTLNLFLHDIRENTKLRRAQPGWEIVEQPNGGGNMGVQRRNAVRLDLHYLVTAWATEPEDEHRLLGRALMALYRHQNLPDDTLPEGLQEHAIPIALKVAQPETLESPNDFWSVMDNQQRPGIPFVVTVAIDPFAPITAPVITTRTTRFGQVPEGQPGRSSAAAGMDEYLRVSGRVRSARSLEGARLTLVERGQDLALHPGGGFVIHNVRPGSYTLELSLEGRKPRRFALKVPSPSYDIEVK
jgi:hypothetical protein